jgi:hypothetical protein
MTTAPPPPKAVEMPPDGQVMRDLEGPLVQLARGLGERARNVRIVGKQLDEYEKDECNVVVEGKVPGGIVRYVLVYQRNADFWKLRDIQDRIYPR